MSVNTGGNIEFTFNTIDDYKNGLSGDANTSAAANPGGGAGAVAQTVQNQCI